MEATRAGAAWTPQEVKRMRRFARSGATARKVAAALGRTRKAVQDKAQRAGRIRFRAEPRRGSVDRDRLRTLIAEGATVREAAAEFGCSGRQVSRMAGRMGLRFHGPGPRPNAERWSVVAAYVGVGFDTAGKLAKLLGVNHDTFNRTVRRMVAAGILERVGAGRASRLTVGRAWRGGE